MQERTTSGFAQDECIRLYDKDGKHCLSILNCSSLSHTGDPQVLEARNVDVSTPSGSVMFCVPTQDFSGVVEAFRHAVEKIGL